MINRILTVYFYDKNINLISGKKFRKGADVIFLK